MVSRCDSQLVSGTGGITVSRPEESKKSSLMEEPRFYFSDSVSSSLAAKENNPTAFVSRVVKVYVYSFVIS